MLFEKIDKIKQRTIIFSIILMFLGLILVILPGEDFRFINFLLGSVLIIVFIYTLFRHLSSKKRLMNYIKLGLAGLIGILGVVFLAFDNFLIILLTWLVGTLPIFLGAIGLFQAFYFARPSGRKGWWILVVLSTILLLFSVGIFVNPYVDNVNDQARVVGGTMLYASLVNMISFIWTWPIKKDEYVEAD